MLQRGQLVTVPGTSSSVVPSATGARVVRCRSVSPQAIWTRPSPDRNEEWVKPSYVPQPNTQPAFTPSRREEQPLYAPAMPEFRPAETPDKSDKEMPQGPKMPERRPDPIPAGNPKKERPPGEDDKREAPPEKKKE